MPNMKQQVPAGGFFNLPVVKNPETARAALLAVPFMTPTGKASTLCADAPEALRLASAEVKPGRWDVDLQRQLFADQPIDLGLFPLLGDATVDRNNLAQRVAEIVSVGGRPLIVGGDDSVAIPPLQGLDALDGGVHVVQIDAHLDWKDRWHNEKWGRSSVMRRAAEMPCINGITQIGLRGSGTALPADAAAASHYGTLITSRMMKKMGVDDMLRHITDEWLPIIAYWVLIWWNVRHSGTSAVQGCERRYVCSLCWRMCCPPPDLSPGC